MADFKTEYNRPAGWRFALAGANVSSSPDSLQPDKYAALLNARTSGGTSIRARPGLVGLYTPFATDTARVITDLSGFAALGTENTPIIVSRSSGNAIALNGAVLARLSTVVPSSGVSFLAFRPNQSPQAWMYVTCASDFQKIQAPNGPAQKVGIAEPQAACDAAEVELAYTEFTALAASWTAAGVASLLADAARTTDTLLQLYADPATTTRYSLQVSRNIQYQIGATILLNATLPLVIADVLPPICAGAALTVLGSYFNPLNGRTMIVPSQMGLGTTENEAQLGQLRRGALVALSGSTFTGAGLNDATLGGTYNGQGQAVVVITIDGVGTPDTFSWSINGGAVTAHVPITGAAQALTGSGLTIHFAATTGHTLGNSWSFATGVLFVLDSVTGDNGSICFEVAGNLTIPANAKLSGVPAIAVNTSLLNLSFVGQSLTSAEISATLTFTATPAVTEAIGTISQPLAANPFARPLGVSTSVPQADDYVHFSVLVSDPTQINEIKIIFNVDPTVNYQKNVFYYSVRPNDLAGVATNQQTQLAAILEASTNALIENQVVPTGQAILQAALSTSVHDIASAPGQTSAGSGQWTEVIFPISGLQFLGGNENTSLLNCNGVQLMFNTSGSVTVAFGSIWLGGGGQTDIGVDGAGTPYQYRLVPRSTLTGAMGNATPAMWYGIRPTRQGVSLNLPAIVESQQDIWDIYRYGGSVLEYRWLANGPPLTQFTDQFFDDALRGGNLLAVDNFEPFPSIDVPFLHPGGVATGTYILLTGGYFPPSMPRWLPGTLFQVANNQAFTLRLRPQFLAANQVLLTFEESIGYLAATGPIAVYEPKVARQFCGVGWGPNEYGDSFFVGDPLRPGWIYFPKSNNPDSAPDTNCLEISDPSQPLIGGVCVGGLSYVSSPDNWWALYPSFNSATRYSKRGAAIGRGLVSPRAVCTDGAKVYFWAKDCIAMSNGGAYQSLTDPDLYVLFPHEGVAIGQNVTRLGVTFYAPDYSRTGAFRLNWANQYLFADYVDLTGTPRTLVCDLRTGGWCVDQYGSPVTVHGRLAQQPGSTSTVPALYEAGLVGDVAGNVSQEQDLVGGMAVVVGTFEWDGGDLRASPLFGDSYLDCLPSSPITVQPVSLGQPIGSPTVIAATPNRTFAPISLEGGETIKYLGLSITWQESYTGGIPTTLYLYQHSVSPQPETTTDRASDWTDCGTEGNKWFQGFLLNADTKGADKGLLIEDSETDTLHAIQPTKVNHNGQEIQAYSFVTPFYSHLVRDVPQDAVPWKKFEITYIFQPAPESAQTWWTQSTAFGLNGYSHIGRLEPAYAATKDITLTITAQDGTSPAVITLPANGGVYTKIMVLPTFNKGQSYVFQAQSIGPFRLYLNDWIVWVGAWGREGPYIPYRLLGGVYGDQANV